MPDVPVIRCGSAEPKVDSREIAKRLGLQHKSVYKTLKEHKADFETFGIYRFQIDKLNSIGRPEQYAMLNEDQCRKLREASAKMLNHLNTTRAGRPKPPRR